MKIRKSHNRNYPEDMVYHATNRDSLLYPKYVMGSVFSSQDGTFRICVMAGTWDHVGSEVRHHARDIQSLGAGRRKLHRVMRRLRRNLQQVGVKV